MFMSVRGPAVMHQTLMVGRRRGLFKHNIKKDALCDVGPRFAWADSHHSEYSGDGGATVPNPYFTRRLQLSATPLAAKSTESYILQVIIDL